MDSTRVTISYVLHHWATHQPETAAFIFRDSHRRRRVLTRADVYRLASRFAAILRRHDVRRGDLVCNTLPNSPERVLSDLGVILAGAVAVNGQILLADGEDFIGSLQDSRCMAVILDPLELSGAKRVLNLLEQEVKDDGKVYFPKVPALRMIYECHWEGQGEQVSFMDTLEQERDSYVADVTPDDLAYVWTTSGSTGFSKLVPHTHWRLLLFAKKAHSFCCGLPYSETFAGNEVDSQETIEPASHAGDHSEDDVHVDPNADSHNAKSKAQDQEEGRIKSRLSSDVDDSTTRRSRFVYFTNGNLGWSGGYPGDYYWYGTTRVMLDLSRGYPDDFVAAWWTLAREEGCEYSFILPFHLQELVSRKELWQSSGFRLKVVGMSGYPVHKTLLKNAIGNVCDSINVLYGSSDTGPITVKSSVNPDLYQNGNSGKPLPGADMKVVDENLQEIPPGGETFGEVLVRADTALEYYLGNPEVTKKSLLPDGWCRMGDVGYLNEEGDLFLVCRTAFGIMRGAFNVYPGWLESRIKTHPAVREALVVPVPDPVLHQELCACLMVTPGAEVTAEEMRQYCKGLFLTGREDPKTAVPRYFLFFTNLPTTSTGKLCRRTTAAEAKARLFGDA